MLPALVVAWVVLGAVSVVVMHRRGHDAFGWAIPFLFLGPLALPVATTPVGAVVRFGEPMHPLQHYALSARRKTTGAAASDFPPPERPSWPSAASVVFFRALTHDYELIVTGSHTFGRSRLGTSGGSRLGGPGRTVPVLIGPGHP